jgi:hypothetical protein
MAAAFLQWNIRNPLDQIALMLRADKLMAAKKSMLVYDDMTFHRSWCR